MDLAVNAEVNLGLLAQQRLAVFCPPNGYAVLTILSGLSNEEGQEIAVTGVRELWWPVPGRLKLKAYGGAVRYELSGGLGEGAGLSKAQEDAIAAGSILDPNGGVQGLSELSPVVTLTASGQATAAPGEFRAVVIRAAVGFPQTVQVFDALSATGDPVATFTVNALGKYFWDGSWTTPGTGKGARRPMSVGCYVTFSGGTSRTADVEVV